MRALFVWVTSECLADVNPPHDPNDTPDNGVPGEGGYSEDPKNETRPCFSEIASTDELASFSIEMPTMDAVSL